ncbi:hypothetical protein ACFVAF_25485 [Streptomyces sp. NPDC057596]
MTQPTPAEAKSCERCTGNPSADQIVTWDVIAERVADELAALAKTEETGA